MRTLMIAGLAMVTVAAATPADSQQAPSGHQWRSGGQWQGQSQGQGGGQWHGGGQVGGQTGGAPVMMPPHGGGQAMPPHGGGWQGSQPPHQSRWGGSVGGHWYGGANAPGGWNAYRRPSRGWTLPRYWIAPTFFISDYGTYGLSTPPRGYNWSRYYDDAVLLDQNGRVYDTVGGIDWDSYDSADSYGDDGGYGAPYPPPPYAGPPIQGGYSTTTYSTSGYQGSGGYVSGGYWYPPVTTTTVTIQSAPVVTTTTTEYIEETRYVPARRIYRAVKRKWHPKPRCGCGCCR